MIFPISDLHRFLRCRLMVWDLRRGARVCGLRWFWARLPDAGFKPQAIQLQFHACAFLAISPGVQHTVDGTLESLQESFQSPACILRG